MPAPRVGTAFVAIQGDFAPLGKQLRARGGIMARQSTRIGAAVGAGIAGAAVGAGVGAFKIGAAFDDAYDKIRVGTGATGKRLKGLQGDFKDVVKDVPTDFASASSTVADLNKRLGLTGKPLRQLSKQMLELSRITESDVNENVAATSRLFGDWSVKTDKQSRTLDKLFRLSQATGIGVGELSREMVAFGSPLRQLGFGFDRAAAMFAKFEKEGVNTSALMPGLKFALKNLSAPTDALSAKFKKLGVDVQAGPASALQDVMAAIKKAPNDLKANAIAFDIFGQRAGPDMAAAIREGRFELGDLQRTMRRGKDTIRGAASDTEDLSEKWIKFKNRALVRLEPVAARVFNGVGREADRLFKILDDPQLTTDEKIEKVFDRIGALLSAAVPKITGAIEQIAPKAARAFIKGFANAPAWAQLLGSGFLLKKLGLAGGLGNLLLGKGGKGPLGSGGGLGGKPVPVFVVNQGGIPGAGGKGVPVPVGLPGRLKGLAKGAGKLGAAAAAIDFGINLVDSRGNPIAATINSAHDLTFGITPKVKRDLEAGVKTRNEASETARSFVPLSGQRPTPAKGHFDKQGFPISDEDWAKQQPARDAAAKRSAALQAGAFSNAWIDGLKKNHAPTGLQMKGMLAVLDDLKPRTRRIAAESIVGMAAAMTEKGTLPKGSARKIRRAIVEHFDGMKVSSVKKSAQMVIGVGGSMTALGNVVTSGLQLLSGNVGAALKVFGVDVPKLSLKHPKNSAHELGQGAGNLANTIGSILGAQRGGPIIGGRPVGDSIPALLERGEYVFNREAVKKVGRDRLDAVNFGAAPRFQRGGMAGMIAAANRVERASFPYVWGGGHQGSPAPFGPFDCSGAVSYILQQGGVKIPTMTSGLLASAGLPGPGPVTVFANIAHTLMRLGKRFFGTSTTNPGGGAGWIEETPSASYLSRFTQRHFPAVGGSMDIARVLVDGPDSPIKNLAQAALDRTRAAARQRVNDLTATPLGAGDAQVSDVTGNGADLMRRIAKQRGWNFADWWELDRRETGHGANLTNPTSTARLRGQFLDSNWGKYGPGSDPAQNPSMAQQIQAMAAYIAERYGNPTAARQFHDAHNYYKLGGLVGLQAGGPAKGVTGAKGVRRDMPGRPVGLGAALRKVRAGKTPKIRKDAISGLVERIKGIDLPKALKRTLSSYATDANTFGEFAERAAQLTVEPVDGGDPIEGVVGGKTQTQWLTDQLAALFRWRNAIIDAEQIVVERREQIAKLIERARERLKTIVAEIGKTAKTRKAIAGQLERAQKHPKRNRALIKILRGNLGKIDVAQRVSERVRTGLRDKILPALITRRDGLTAFRRDDLLPNLETVQGIGSPTSRLSTLPTLGVLGGTILDTQLRLRDLAAPRETITDTASPVDDSPSVSALAELLRQEKVRLAVSQAHFDEFKRALPAFGGSFATGGIVPGPVGAPRTIIAHGGETVLTADESLAGGTVVHVNVAPGMEWLGKFIDVRVEQHTLDQSNRARRQLPGQAGVLRR